MTDLNKEQTERNLDAMLGNLPKEALPERDLWPAIEATIDQQSGAKASWRYMGLAATICLGLFVAHLLTGQDNDAPPAVADNGIQTTPVYVDQGEELDFVVPTPIARLTSYPGQKFSLARDSELEELELHIDRLPENEREIVRGNLANIRQALSEIDAALAENPNNTLLKELLVQTYQRELNTIASVNRISGSMRNDL